MPTPPVDRIMCFFALISRNRRISVERIREVTGLPKSTVYRYIDAASAHLPIRMEGGIVINDDPARSVESA